MSAGCDPDPYPWMRMPRAAWTELSDAERTRVDEIARSVLHIAHKAQADEEITRREAMAFDHALMQIQYISAEAGLRRPAETAR